MRIFEKGFTFEYAGLIYKKLTDDICSWWVCQNSFYLVPVIKDGELTHERHPESEKPLFKENGELNRWSFKMPDTQVREHYNL